MGKVHLGPKFQVTTMQHVEKHIFNSSWLLHSISLLYIVVLWLYSAASHRALLGEIVKLYNIHVFFLSKKAHRLIGCLDQCHFGDCLMQYWSII